MTSQLLVAQVSATNPKVAAELHLISRIRGRLDALETATAGQDARAQLRALLEAWELFDELTAITYGETTP